MSNSRHCIKRCNYIEEESNSGLNERKALLKRRVSRTNAKAESLVN